MKILLVGDYPNDPRLGSAKVPHKLREEFRALGHECDALFSEDLGEFPRQRHLGQALRPAVAARAIARAFRERGPYEVVDIASAEGFLFGLQRRLGKYPGTAFISRSNGLEHLNYQRMIDDHHAGLLHKPLTRRFWYPLVRLSQVAGAARLSDRLILLNEQDRAFALKKGWKREEFVDVVPHGVSSAFLGDSNSLREQRGGGILFCGTWDRLKGITYLVEAFTQLIEGGSTINLSVIGGGVPDEQVLGAFPPHVRPFVSVRGKIPEEELMRQYRRHDLFVFCSTYEGFGIVLIEAMSQGLPAVSTPVGCATTLIADGETGLIVPPRNARALAGAIRRMLGDPTLRHGLAENASQAVREMSWRRTALRTIAVYQRAIETRSTKLCQQAA
jgi:glycosyltransferase involved in cell wall biosynthesis